MKRLLALTLLLSVLTGTAAHAGTIDPAATQGRPDATAPTVTSPMTDGTVTVDMKDGAEPVIFEITGHGTTYDVANYTCVDGVWTRTAAYVGLSGTNSVRADNQDGRNTDKTALNGETTNWLVITYVNEKGETVQMGYRYYVDWFQYQDGITGEVKVSYSDITLPQWYVDNTANVYGPQLEGTWQTCAVVDLSKDGVQTFDLIGAGAWKIGTVTVTVQGDEVVVDYIMTEDRNTRDTWDDITVDSEYLNIFADMAAVDMKAESTFAFGEPISISADLGGDTVVTLYVRNQVDYPAHSPYVTRFWPNHPDNAAVRKAMEALLEE